MNGCSPPSYGGAHRRPSEAEQEARRHRVEEPPRAWSATATAAVAVNRSRSRAPEPQFAWQPTQQERAADPRLPNRPPPPPAPERRRRAGARTGAPEPDRAAQAPDWQPAPAEGEWIPAGAPGSNWVSPAARRFAGSADGRRRRRRQVPDATAPPAERFTGQPAELTSAGDGHAEPRCRPRPPTPPRAATPHRPTPSILGARLRHRHWPPNPEDARRQPEPEPSARTAACASRRRGGTAAQTDTGGQSVAELLAGCKSTPTGGGRRRRREE